MEEEVEEEAAPWPDRRRRPDQREWPPEERPEEGEALGAAGSAPPLRRPGRSRGPPLQQVLQGGRRRRHLPCHCTEGAAVPRQRRHPGGRCRRPRQLCDPGHQPSPAGSIVAVAAPQENRLQRRSRRVRQSRPSSSTAGLPFSSHASHSAAFSSATEAMVAVVVMEEEEEEEEEEKETWHMCHRRLLH